jgi:hypothetical protein
VGYSQPQPQVQLQPQVQVFVVVSVIVVLRFGAGCRASFVAAFVSADAPGLGSLHLPLEIVAGRVAPG